MVSFVYFIVSQQVNDVSYMKSMKLTAYLTCIIIFPPNFKK